MEVVVFEINSNDEIFELVDKRFEDIFIHKFNPHQTIEWWRADLKTAGLDLKNVSVRNMEFDIITDFEGLRDIIALKTNQLRIYQFEKPVFDTLVIENLPQEFIEKILLQNGLKHSFYVDFEIITIESFDNEFVESIRNNPVFSKRIEERKIKAV